MISTAELEVEAMSVPAKGITLVSPSGGTAFETEFGLQLSGWDSDITGYQVFVRDQKEVLAVSGLLQPS